MTIFEVKVANLGRNDEDQVKIIAYSNELGINVVKEIEDLDEGDAETITFNLNLPQSLDEKLYKIRFSTEFNYDDDDEEYRDESDSEDDIVRSLTVFGGEYKSPTISPSLISSDPRLNEEITIQVSVTNNGQDGNYVVSAANFESWAELVSVNPQVLTLDKGETAQTIVKLKPTTTGEQAFTIKTVANGEESSQQVSVIIAEEKGFLESMDNWTIYLIAGIAALLILVVLVMIIKVSRRPARATPEF